MTETEWLASDDFHALGFYVTRLGQVSRRKLLLFLYARCRHLLEPAAGPGVAAHLELFRRHVETGFTAAKRAGLGDAADLLAAFHPTPASAELREAVRTARDTTQEWEGQLDIAGHLFPLRFQDDDPARYLPYIDIDRRWRDRRRPEYRPSPLAERPGLPDALQADWLRDLFGNPFAPCPVTPEQAAPWLQADGGTAGQLLAAIAAADRYADLPILADAIEEAGCDAADLLAHLRGGTQHVRGCWAVDLLAGQG